MQLFGGQICDSHANKKPQRSGGVGVAERSCDHNSHNGLAENRDELLQLAGSFDELEMLCQSRVRVDINSCPRRISQNPPLPHPQA